MPPKPATIRTKKTFWRTCTEETKNWLAEALYYEELETIRHPAPLIDDAEILTVDLFDSQNPGLRGGDLDIDEDPIEDSQGGNTSIIIGSDSDSGEGTTEPETPGSSAEPPGPFTPMKNNPVEIRKRIGFRAHAEQYFGQEFRTARLDYLTEGQLYSDQEAMLQHPDWLPRLENRYADVDLLFKGFPLVEEVTFVKHPNYWKDFDPPINSGQCYWLAVALLVYGNARSWLRVKAEHLYFLEKVLSTPDHPRHEFYKRANGNSSKALATGRSTNQWGGVANLWEKLAIPGCWCNDEIINLTADVYSVFVVLYKYDGGRDNKAWEDKCYDMLTYGAFNNRHLFICYYNSNHFQPMIPNDFYHYEFRLPRITIASTKKYNLVTSSRNRRQVKNGPNHYWRGPAGSIPPSLSVPRFEEEHLTRVVGYGPYTVKSREPEHPAPSTGQSEVRPLERPPVPPSTPAKPNTPGTGSSTDPVEAPSSPESTPSKPPKIPTVLPGTPVGGTQRPPQVIPATPPPRPPIPTSPEKPKPKPSGAALHPVVTLPSSSVIPAMPAPAPHSTPQRPPGTTTQQAPTKPPPGSQPTPGNRLFRPLPGSTPSTPQNRQTSTTTPQAPARPRPALPGTPFTATPQTPSRPRPPEGGVIIISSSDDETPSKPPSKPKPPAKTPGTARGSGSGTAKGPGTDTAKNMKRTLFGRKRKPSDTPYVDRGEGDDDDDDEFSEGDFEEYERGGTMTKKRAVKKRRVQDTAYVDYRDEEEDDEEYEYVEGIFGRRVKKKKKKKKVGGLGLFARP